MGASAYEYLREVEMANLRLKGIGNISCYEARNSGTTMYQYALHGLWFTLKCMGVDVERIGHRTANPITAPGLTTLEHRRDSRLFYGTLHHAPLKNILCSVRAYGANGDFEVTCGDDGRPWYKDVFTYLEMLHSIERMIRTRKPPEPLEYTEATLPPDFNVAAGHQVPGMLSIPLSSFPVGDYRLEIKVTDKAANKSITQNVNFSVTA